jgi:putative tricarboxylic transport membrane protein
MKRPYQIAGVGFLLFAAFALNESRKLKYYSSLGPGPGFFPFWVSLFIGLLALAMLYEATWKSQEPMPADFIASRMGYVRSVSILVALVLMVATIERLGFRLAMFGFYLFLLVALGRQNIFVTIAIALAGSFGIFYVFAEWLKIPLPVGVFGL